MGSEADGRLILRTPLGREGVPRCSLSAACRAGVRYRPFRCPRVTHRRRFIFPVARSVDTPSVTVIPPLGGVNPHSRCTSPIPNGFRTWPGRQQLSTARGRWTRYRPSDRASRATRRASWRGTGVRAAGVDTAMTRAAAVSASVRQPAWASTGRAPGLVHVHRPTVRPWSSAGLSLRAMWREASRRRRAAGG